MTKVFNPPPNWPTPPEAWQPPVGWQPDPAWGAAPEGWSLWVRPNRHPLAKAFCTAAVVYLALLAAIVSTGSISDEGAGRLFANVVLLPGLIIGLIARASARRWQWWRYLVGVLVTSAVLLVISGLGSMPQR